MTDRAHGTRAKYVLEKCRCEPCTAANREYVRASSQRAAPAYVDAGPARRHITELRDAGVGLKTVAKAAGVSHGALSKLVYGETARGGKPTKRIRPETMERILAVTPADVADGATVD